MIARDGSTKVTADDVRTRSATTVANRESTRIGSLALTTVHPLSETGVPVLFVHGLFAGAWMFERWMPYFAERGHRASAVDLRGHGESAPVPDRGKIQLADYIEDAAAVVRTLGPAAVVGHSMGGLIAQALAQDGLAAASVLVAPAPPRGVPLLSLRLLVREARYLPSILRSREVVVQRRDADALILNCVPVEERDTLFRRFEPDSGRAGRDIMLGAVSIDASRVNCPVLVVAGAEDRFIPAHVSRRVAAKYGAGLATLPRRGHVMMQEPGWDEAAEVVRAWLAAL